MNRKRMLLVAVLALASVAGAGCGYNTLNAKQQNVRGKWANVESQLQRRADLIGNLVETAKMAAVCRSCAVWSPFGKKACAK